MAGHQFVASVQAVFTFGDRSQIESDIIGGPPITAGPGGGPTATPLATATPFGFDRLLRTSWDYAFVQTRHADNPLAADGWVATTWGNRDPTTFYWPAGWPLRLVPGTANHTNLLFLRLQGERNATAYLNPDAVQSITYTLTAPGCTAGGACCPAATPGSAPPLQAYGQSPAYPGESDPARSTQSALVWSPQQAVPSASLGAISHCRLEDVLRHGGVVTMTYTMVRQAHFTGQFPTPTATSTATPIPPLVPIVVTTTPAPSETPQYIVILVTPTPRPTPTVTPTPLDATALPSPTWPAWTPAPTPLLTATTVPGCGPGTDPHAYLCLINPTATAQPAFPGWPAATPTPVLINAVRRDSAIAGLAPLGTAVTRGGGTLRWDTHGPLCADPYSCQLEITLSEPERHQLVYRVLIKVDGTPLPAP